MQSVYLYDAITIAVSLLRFAVPDINTNEGNGLSIF